jgi:hypothetical protein
MKNKKNNLMNVANSYAINAVKEYNLRNDRKIDVDGLFDGLTCGQIESMITLFECMTHLEYKKNKPMGIINRSYKLAEKISHFYYYAKRKDNFKFVVLDILDFVDYQFNDAMCVMEQLNIENISMERLKFIAYVLYQSYQGKKEWYNYRNYNEQIMSKYNIIFNEEIVKSMKDAVENNSCLNVEYDLFTNSYNLSNYEGLLPDTPNFIISVDTLMSETEEDIVALFIKHIDLVEQSIEGWFNAFKENKL